MKKISIIIVNYKQTKVTIELLKSIRDICIYPDLEIIIIDNDAEFGTENIFKSVIPELVYLPLNWNAGFAKANNLGAELAKGKYLFFLNNDTIITSGILHHLVSTMESNDEYGIICPLIKYYDQPNRIQYAGYSKINPNTGRNKTVTKIENDSIYETEYAHGAAFFMSKMLYTIVGGLDENYFLYYEELDLSTKVKNLGYKIVVNTNVFIYHKVSISTGKNSPLKSYYMSRNKINYQRKHSSSFEYFKFTLYTLGLSAPINMFRLIISRSWKNLYYYIIGIKDGLFNITGFKKIA